MKKISLVMLDARREKALRSLKKLGAVHLEAFSGKGEKYVNLEGEKNFLEKCYYSLPKMPKGAAPRGYTTRQELDEIAGKIDGVSGRITELRDAGQAFLKERDRIAFLGDFDPRGIRELEAAGIKIDLHQLGKDEMKLFLEGEAEDAVGTAGGTAEGGASGGGASPERTYFVVARDKTTFTVAHILRGDDKPFEKTPLELPAKSLGEMEEDYRNNLAELARLRDELAELAVYSGALKTGLAILEDQIEFERVYSGIGGEDQLIWLTGWCPATKVEALKDAAGKNGWALLVKDPEGDEQPPTLLQNKAAVRIIQPVMSFLGVVPGYREYDISMWFLLFFTLFTAMIIGDAAYGLIFLAAAIGLTVRNKGKKLPDMIKLLYVLSIATVAWGALTGSWFGSEAIASQPFFKSLQFWPIANSNPDGTTNVMLFSFILGAVHLVLAHIMNIVKYRRSLAAVADLGQLAMILGLFNLVLFLVIDPAAYPVQQVSLYMIFGGFGSLIIFGQQEKGQSFLKGILKGVAGLFQTFLNSISNFSDIISYIRLYAVGLATLAISQSFNTMATNIPGFIGIIAMILILLLGHGLNIIMALLSVIVHGVRLNLLEFSGHLNMEWSGYEYAPFCEKELVNQVSASRGAEDDLGETG